MRKESFALTFLSEHALAAFTIAAASLFVVFPLMNFDIFWHMANGREMLNQGRIINEEVFSYTAQGTPFQNHEWLSQIIFHLVYKNWGVAGLINLKALVVGLTAVFLFTAVRFTGVDRLSASLIVLAVVSASIHRFTVRPHLFSLFFLSVVQFLLYGFRTSRLSRNWIFLIPFIMFFWDMFHGAIYGLLFLFAFMAAALAEAVLERFGEESRERLKWAALVSLLSLALMAISPFGLRNYGSFISFGGQSNLMVALVEEFNPTRLNEFGLFWALLAAVAVPGVLTFRRSHLAWLVLLLPFAVLSIRYNRAIPAFGIVSAPVLGHLILTMYGAGGRKASVILKVLLSALFVAMVFYMGQVKFGPGNFHSFGYGFNDKYIPYSAVRFLRNVEIEGNIFNNGEYGGLIAYELYPEKKMFMYNHHIIFQNVFLESQSRRIFEKHGITHAMVNYTSEWNNLLFKPGDWVPVHWQGDMAILARNIPANREIIAGYALKSYLPGTTVEELRDIMTAVPYATGNIAAELARVLSFEENRELAALLSEVLLSERHPLSAGERGWIARNALSAAELNPSLKSTLSRIPGN